MINLCIPVLKRYDLLRELFLSLGSSTLMPSCVYVINNGRDMVRLNTALAVCPTKFWVETPTQPMGVAESWNWFIDNTSEERVIVNDDITFGRDSLKQLTMTEGDMVCAAGCGLSCFVMRDALVARVGVFDESISPGYGYYEDDDYFERIYRAGARVVDVDCAVVHGKSQTLAAFTEAEMAEHHRKFHIARANFVAKWGAMPGDLRAARVVAS